MANPKVSIIIPVVRINDYIHESIRHILNLKFQDFEVLIFPNQKTKVSFPKTKIITTGEIGPAAKRNLALKYAQGEILAFLDDDAYPRSDWLTKALVNFKNPRLAALGGPAITPPHDSLLQKASGACLQSLMVSGEARERYLPGKQKKIVHDWPSVNFLIRKKIFAHIHGFNTHFWPGEDTKLCLDVIKNGGQIIYDPQLVVYHHRRRNLKSHLKQIGGYGLHRGYFAKNLPQTSRKLPYFLPSLFLLFILATAGLFLFFPQSLLTKYAGLLLGFYSLGILGSAMQAAWREKSLSVGLLVIPFIFLTHLVYGLRFIQGFIFTQKLESKLRT